MSQADMRNVCTHMESLTLHDYHLLVSKLRPVCTDTEIVTLEVSKIHNPKSTFAQYDFIYEICKREYKFAKNGGHTFSRTSDMKDVPKTSSVYTSALEYKDTYCSLLYIETIQQLFRTCTENRATWITVRNIVAADLNAKENFRKPFISDDRFYSALLEYRLTSRCFNDDKIPLRNSLICIKYMGKYNLAFVESMRSEPRLDFSKPIKSYPNRTIATLILRVAMIAPILNKWSGDLIQVRFISRLSAVFKMYLSLHSIESSPFVGFLLNPPSHLVSSHFVRNNLLLSMELNKEQNEAVLSISQGIFSDRSETTIKMIHGPPGTGKTKTILALIGQLYKMSQAKSLSLHPIMLCAPSNAAADELTLRIADLKEYGILLKIKRIGMINKIKEEVLPYFLEESLDYSMKEILLKNSDVIVSTLSSSFSSLTRKMLFSCCIIDEASQCHEPESLISFLLTFSKLVLVGDPKQLSATILSRKAALSGLNISLFERFYDYMKLKSDCDGIYQLIRQYRMHESIAAWPSRYFYSDTLVTPPTVTASRSCNIRPYIIFDLKFTREVKVESSTRNDMEAEFIGHLFNVLKPHIKDMDVGIITPYNAQRLLLKDRLNHLSRVTISTVDMFQGQEQDIIIFSCVRANHWEDIGFLRDLSRLNVALTRAKRSCLVIGNLETLDNHAGWRPLIKDAYKRRCLCPVNMKYESDVSQIIFENIFLKRK